MGRFKDLTGQRFGKLTAVCPTGERQNGSVIWKCKCNCGKTVLANAGNLKSGGTKSCGCLRKKKDLSKIEDYEDKVFRKIMDIHLEEVSKEILRDMAENPSDEPKPSFDEFAKRIGADVYSDLPNIEIDPNDITPEELFRTWAVAKGFMEIRKEPTTELLELMQKEQRGEITVEEITTEELLKKALAEYEDERCAEIIEKYKDYEPEEPLPPFEEFMKKVEARQKALEEVK